MPATNLKTPSKKSGASASTIVLKKPAVKKAAAASKPAAPKKTATQPAAEKKTAPVKKPAAKKTSAKAPAKGNGQTAITPEQRYRMICDAAYYRAERRGFVGGNPYEDWVAAEAEIDALLHTMSS